MNVFFEAGLAFGFGKIVTLAEHANEDASRARQVFPEYLRMAYHHSDEVAAAAMAVKPDATLTIDTITATEDRSRIYFIDPGIDSDYTRTLRRLLKDARSFSYAAPDGGVLQTPTMHSLLYEIKAAGVIVGLLVPETYLDQDIANARSSFLLGVAVALGKPVLALMQEPMLKGPADLRMLREPVGSTATLRTSTESWLTSIRSAARPQKAVAAADVRKIDIGNAWAERDPALRHYFLETAHYRRARDAVNTVFLGRRGTGKSAIGYYLTDPELQGHGVALRRLRPEEFEMQELQDAYLPMTDARRPHWQLTLGAVWRYLLVSELAKTYLDHLAEKPARDESLDELEGIVAAIPHQDGFLNRVLAVTAYVKGAKEADLKDFVGRMSRPTIYEPFQKLSSRIPARLVIDNLDSAWDTSHERNRFVLASLVREAERLNQRLAPRAAILLFLRTDIYNIVKLADPDIDKHSKERLTWNSDGLIELVGLRLAYLLDLRGSAWDAWNSVFPVTVEGTSSADFMISQTMQRPRELLKLCGRAIEIAQARRSRRVSETDVIDALQSYSDDLLTDLHGEYLVEYPDLYYFVLELSNETWPKGIDEARAIIRTASQKELRAGRGGNWLRDPAPDALLRNLYDIGIIGLEGSGKRVFSFDREWSSAYAATRRQVDKRYGRGKVRKDFVEPQVVLHPGLWPVLGASATELRSRYRQWANAPI